MSIITYNNIADGTSIEAADLNAPINDIVNVINGNIDATNISAGTITTAKMVPTANIETWRAESTVNFCASGCVFTQSAGLIGAMTAGVVYIGGVRVSVDAVVSKTFTASKDTYVDVGSDGIIDYYEKANGAASQALEAGHFRLAKVITSGVAITNAAAATIVPSFQNGIDSLGNTIFNTNPYGIIQWYFPTLLNNWVDYDLNAYQKTCYGKSKSGMVQIYGLVKSGTLSQNIFVLPVGYRPTVNNLFPTIANGAIARIDLKTDGSIYGFTVHATYTSLCMSFQAVGGN